MKNSFNKLSIRVKLMITHGIMIVSIVTIIGFNITLTKIQQFDAIRINLAGRQRMLSQRMTKESLLFKDGVIEKDKPLLSMQVFDTTLDALNIGGSAPLDLKMKNMRHLPAMEDPETRDQLNKVTAIWQHFEANLLEYINNEEVDNANYETIVARSEELLKEMNKAVFMMQETAEGKVKLFYIMIIIIIFLTIYAYLFSISIAKKHIIHPLEELQVFGKNVIAGNYEINNKIEGHDEISDVSKVLNLMVSKLLKSFDKEREILAMKKNQEFQYFFENLNDAMIVTKDGKTVLSNNAALELFIFEDFDHFKQVQMIDFVKTTSRNKQIILRKRDKMFNNTRKVNHLKFEYDCIKSSGEVFPAEIRITTLNVEDERTTIFIIRDLTSQKEIEKAVIAARISAEESSKAKSEFLANMSHEIRTPMNGVIGMNNLLLETKLTEEQRRFALTVKHSSDSLLTIINDILDFSKIEAGKLTIEEIDFDLQAFITEFATSISYRTSEKGLKFVTKSLSNLPKYVKGDSGRLKQILYNLVGNAVKFTSEGQIELDCKVVERGAESYLIKFAVSDTGIGIEEDQKEKLFEKFKQADGSITRKYGGTGLGLAISKQLSFLMGGAIGVESVVNEGSTFWFTVKFSKSDKIAKHLALGSLENIRVLVVDDDHTTLTIVGEMLKSWHISFSTVSNAKDALQVLDKAHQEKQPFDIAIIDRMMPKTDGFVLGKRIKENPLFEDIRMILITSVDPHKNRKQFVDVGFSGFLVKPIKSSELFNCLMLVEGIADETVDAHSVITQNTIREQKLKRDKYKILIVEDNRINRIVARESFKKLGYTVEMAEDGLIGLQMVMQNRYDIVFMDVQMPVMNGLESTMKIREYEYVKKVKRVPIVAMTANAIKGDKEECLAVGMDDYIAKPIDLEEVKRALKKWL